jgi:hypothetical protein
MNRNESKTRKAAPVALPQADARKCQKLSISLFQTDMTKLDGIRSFMESNGKRISTSQAVKLALRTAPLSTELLEALAAIQAEDGRA